MNEPVSISAKLKPCPLCGGATLTRAEIIRVNNLGLTVNCLKCGCRRTTTIEILDTSFDAILRAIYKATDEWNRRAEDATICEKHKCIE